MQTCIIRLDTSICLYRRLPLRSWTKNSWGGGMDNDFHMAHIYLSQISVVGRGGGTECIFYCKRAILFLSSSKILTPIPLSARRVCTPRLCCGGRPDSPGGEGGGGSIFWKTREIGLPSYSKICTLWVEATRDSVANTWQKFPARNSGGKKYGR
jgi:hypothetical protein